MYSIHSKPFYQISCKWVFEWWTIDQNGTHLMMRMNWCMSGCRANRELETEVFPFVDTKVRRVCDLWGTTVDAIDTSLQHYISVFWLLEFRCSSILCPIFYMLRIVLLLLLCALILLMLLLFGFCASARTSTTPLTSEQCSTSCTSLSTQDYS